MDKSIRQGETLQDTIIIDDDTAQTLQFLVATTEGDVIIDETVAFAEVDGKNTAIIDTDDTDHPVGEYEYMYIITYADGTHEHLPDPNNCDGDCSLPTLTICKSLSAGVS